MSDDRFRLLSRPVISWALYDFANTIFSFAVITLYFNEWVIDDMGNPDWYVGAMGFVVALALIATLAPIGAIADRWGRRKPFLLGFTAACITATAALGAVEGTTQALVVGGLAIFCFQSALSHYDPLLGDVAPPSHHGQVSGFGVGMGYVGVLVGSVILGKIVGEGDKQQAFLPTAAMFLLFAIPLALFVRERRRPREDDGASAREVVGAAMGQLRATVRHIRTDQRDIGRLLIGRFLYADAILTVIAYMTIYMERVGDFTATQKTTVLGLSMVFAALSAFVCGKLVQLHGPRWVLLRILGIFAVTLVVAAGTGSAALVWVLGPLVGISLGAVWTSDRVFMLRLAPPAARGEYFAIYNLVGKLSSGIGPLVIWGGCTYVLHELTGWMDLLGASRWALIGLAIVTVLGAWVIHPLDDSRRWSIEEEAAEVGVVPV